MKKSIIVGIIAGFISGIVSFVLNLSGLYELFSVLPYIFPTSVQTIAIHNIVWFVLWGLLWGVLYAFFYDYIPGVGVKKGLMYGLIIWIIANLRPILIAAVYGFYQYAIPAAVIGFLSITIAYGFVIGILYKKE